MKIVTIGDSITYGFPYTPAQSWVHITGRELGIPFINQGINGDTTTGMLRRFKQDVINLAPSHVIIMGGTNDAFARVDETIVINNIRQMTEQAINNRVVPLIGLPIPCIYREDEYILGVYREDMREYAMDNSITVIDFHAGFIKSSQMLYDDAVHPNTEGYKIMANICIATFTPERR
ncbi:GDSL-type esterase/lipase family protein [Sporomusa aerivorans]|uniref:GDSL-type esterase/lipase family protein n=1 Tax=Sporomusa aerivorans TaxID=204936 RepID=UPI00352A1986